MPLVGDRDRCHVPTSVQTQPDPALLRRITDRIVYQVEKDLQHASELRHRQLAFCLRRRIENNPTFGRFHAKDPASAARHVSEVDPIRRGREIFRLHHLKIGNIVDQSQQMLSRNGNVAGIVAVLILQWSCELGADRLSIGDDAVHRLPKNWRQIVPERGCAAPPFGRGHGHGLRACKMQDKSGASRVLASQRLEISSPFPIGTGYPARRSVEQLPAARLFWSPTFQHDEVGPGPPAYFSRRPRKINQVRGIGFDGKEPL